MLKDQDNKAIKEVGEQLRRVLCAETTQFTGNVKFNFKDGKLKNWNIEQSGWPVSQ